MPRRYLILHENWGALRWVAREGRLCAAGRRQLQDDKRGMTPATLFRTIGAAERAIERTVDHWRNLGANVYAERTEAATIVAVEVAP